MIVRSNLYGLLNENMDQARSILKKLRIPESDKQFQELKQKLLADNNIGRIGVFTKWIFVNHEPLERILELQDLLKSNPRKMPSLDTFKGSEEVYDFLGHAKTSSKLNQVLTSIPTKTRENVTDKLKILIQDNIEYADDLIDFFSKAGGRYNRYSQLYSLPPEYKDHKEWLYETVKGLIKNLHEGYNLEAMKRKIRTTNSNVDIVLERPDLLILRPLDYHTSQSIGSERMCICTSKSFWQSYVDAFSNQYFVYDFTKPASDKKSMIAATIQPGGKIKEIQYRNNDGTARHDYKNKEVLSYLTPKKPEEVIEEIKRRIKGIKKEIVKETNTYIIYKIEKSDDIKEVISRGFGYGNVQDDIFYNFYMILDSDNVGFNQVLAVKVKQKGMEIIDVNGDKVESTYLNKFD